MSFIWTGDFAFPKPRHSAGDEVLSDGAWRRRRKILYELAGGSCANCKRHCRNEFEIDHVKPRGMGAGRRRDNMDNLQVLCIPCHRKKHGQ